MSCPSFHFLSRERALACCVLAWPLVIKLCQPLEVMYTAVLCFYLVLIACTSVVHAFLAFGNPEMSVIEAQGFRFCKSSCVNAVKSNPFTSGNPGKEA